jgi:hypothetical protein
MAKKNPIFERLEDQSPTFERIEPDDIEQGLGATRDTRTVGKRVGSPFSLWALRSRLLTDVISTGGRPGRKEAVARKKIPMTEAEWALLDEITRVLNRRGGKATPGQVAGILLHQSMTEVLQRLDRVAPMKATNSPAAQKLTNSELEERVDSILAAAASAEVHLEELRPVALELLRRMRSCEGAEADDE